MNIAIGSDHGGFKLKQHLISFLTRLGFQVRDLGTHDEQSVDYPDFALNVALAVANQSVPAGIIIDGAGVGSTMVANKVPGIRAALCNDLFTARNAKEHNNANILVMGSQVIGPGLAEQIVDLFLKTPFAGGRHERRVKKIDLIDQRYRAVNQNSNPPQIEDIVSRIVQNFLQRSAPLESPPVTGSLAVTDHPAVPEVVPTPDMPPVITDEFVRSLAKHGTKHLVIAQKTLITPLAVDTLRELKMDLKRQE